MTRRIAALPWLSLIWALALPLPALAQDLPAAFAVTDVAAGDVLNIRAAPDATAAIVGSLNPGTGGIEVVEVSPDGKWGLIPLPEGAGWAAMRHLKLQPSADPGRLPHPFACRGTEPFWSLELTTVGGKWSTPDEPATGLSVPEEFAASGGYYALAQDDAGRIFRLMTSRESCSDGMSDRRYGFAARLFITTPDGNQMLNGCCSLDSR